tara:strand:+ start:273 stop:434 length:162 start_codon:yes stop_codon:yes gene_type:complete
MVKKDKKEVKEAVEKVVEEVKAENIPVKIVEAPKGKRLVTGRGGKEWYEDMEK